MQDARGFLESWWPDMRLGCRLGFDLQGIVAYSKLLAHGQSPFACFGDADPRDTNQRQRFAVSLSAG